MPISRFAYLACTLLLSFPAWSQTAADRPIRMLVGYAAGGGADVLARILATPLGGELGQTIIVENRPGAGGTLAAGILAKTLPDGLTLYFSDASFVTAPGIFEKLPYDPSADFSVVANVAALPLAYSVHPSIPATTPAELIALLKANPDKYSYGSPGIGTLHHLSAELIKKQTGIRVVHVPYKGAAPALVDLIGGQIALAITSSTAALSQAASGKLRVIGLTSRERIPGFPNVATMGEGIPGFVATNDLFVLARAGTPQNTIARLSSALKSVLARKEIADAYLAQGALVEWIGAEDTTTRIGRDIARWRTLARDASIRPQ